MNPKIISLVFLFFVCGSIPVAGQDSEQRFGKYMKGQADLYQFNGNVLVAVQGKIIYQKSFGYANFQEKSKLDSNSVFDCGSIAKEFTAVGILLLKDQGRISLSDTLRKFFPELPYQHITIQQMLTHTSGLPDGFDLVERNFDHEKIAYNEDLLRLLASEKPPLLFTPGEDMMYSGTAFNLLASIIEKVSGKSYNSFMADNIFAPLAMTNTRVANGLRSTTTIRGYADGYEFDDSLKAFVHADSLHTGWTSYLAGINGEGMILTTTADLFKWDQALKNQRLLKEQTQAAMLSRQAEKKTYPVIQFGYGMRVGKNRFGNYFFHNGYFPGYLSMHLHYRADDITVIVLSNNESRADFIADALAAIARNEKPEMPALHREQLPGNDLVKFTGSYLLPLTRPPYMVDSPVEILLKNGRLFIHPLRGAEIALKQSSPNTFYYADGSDQQIGFKTGANGKVVGSWYTGWGLKRPIKRKGN